MDFKQPQSSALFISQKHRKKLKHNPEKAAKVWLQLIRHGRIHAFDKQWLEAVMFYGNAFEVAQLIYIQSQNKNDIHRYIRSAIEFVFSLRCSNYGADLDLLMASIKGFLKNCSSSKESKKLCTLISDIAFLPLNEAKQYMKLFYSMESRHGQTIH